MSLFLSKKIIIFLFVGIVFFDINAANADVVKPALIEIIVNKSGDVNIEIRASIEALLTGINGRYKNTKDSPNATKYDDLRKMQSTQLLTEFEKFKTIFIKKLKLTDSNKKSLTLSLISVKIPEPGYTKVPRISLINLKTKVDLSSQYLQWYYPMNFGDNAVRLKQIDKIKQKYYWSQWQWLRDDKASEPLSLTEVVANKPIFETIYSYIILGFDHIFPKGIDHILFILGLFLFSATLKPLLWQITMFTIAHTITLGLSMNGIIAIPSSIVEPLIALSIVYVGIENILAKDLKKSRLYLVFAFGLLHGLGFASVLSEMGMPEDAFVTALISFNIGVELGQLTIIFMAFTLAGFWFSKKSWYKKRITNPASIFIAFIAFYWFIQRLGVNI